MSIYYFDELYFLNSHYREETKPQRYRDLLDLIYESIHDLKNPNINIGNEGIKKVSLNKKYKPL